MKDNDQQFILDNLALFCCPKCQGDLGYENDGFRCGDCQQHYDEVDGIPSLFFANEWGSAKKDVTEEMKSFYEETPFPNYDEFDDVGSLIDKASQSHFANLLSEQIPFGTRILECGCGTGQMSNFLSIANRTVIGTDICINSLKMADDFRQANGLDKAHFYQMNLFRPAFKPNTFDLVISNGVLHHTSDPRLAFKSIATLVKPKGYILIGLYHQYGRLVTDLRRMIFNMTSDKFKSLDQRNSSESIGKAKRNAWFMDQYKNPHESKHTVSEVLGWLEQNDFSFIHSLPKTVPFTSIEPAEKLFKPDKLGNALQRWMVDIGMAFSGYQEGGFFVVIAQKNET